MSTIKEQLKECANSIAQATITGIDMVGTKCAEIVEYKRAKMEVCKLEDERKELMQRFGENVFEMMAQNEIDGDILQDKYAVIKDLNARLEQAKERERILKEKENVSDNE